MWHILPPATHKVDADSPYSWTQEIPRIQPPLYRSPFDPVHATDAWTFQAGSAREQLRSSDPLLRRMAALMQVPEKDQDNGYDRAEREAEEGEEDGGGEEGAASDSGGDEKERARLLEGVLSALPTFSRRYGLGRAGLNVSYVNDELGSAFRHSESPNCQASTRGFVWPAVRVIAIAACWLDLGDGGVRWRALWSWGASRTSADAGGRGEFLSAGRNNCRRVFQQPWPRVLLNGDMRIVRGTCCVESSRVSRRRSPEVRTCDEVKMGGDRAVFSRAEQTGGRATTKQSRKSRKTRSPLFPLSRSSLERPPTNATSVSVRDPGLSLSFFGSQMSVFMFGNADRGGGVMAYSVLWPLRPLRPSEEATLDLLRSTAWSGATSAGARQAFVRALGLPCSLVGGGA